MHKALRSSLAIVTGAACLIASTGCQTHDRRMYTTHVDKNLHTPDPWTPSTTKAADDAAAAIGTSPAGATGANPMPTTVPPPTDVTPPSQ